MAILTWHTHEEYVHILCNYDIKVAQMTIHHCKQDQCTSCRMSFWFPTLFGDSLKSYFFPYFPNVEYWNLFIFRMCCRFVLQNAIQEETFWRYYVLLQKDRPVGVEYKLPHLLAGFDKENLVTKGKAICS